MLNKYLGLFLHEIRTNFKWMLGWILGANAYILLSVGIYPGEEALNSILGLFESEEFFEAFLGNIGGEAPGYRLWLALMMPFMGIAYFVYSLMLGVRLSVGSISNDTGELIHPLPLRRFEFLGVRFLVGLVGLFDMLLVGGLLMLIPVGGEALPFANVLTIWWWGMLFLMAALSLGMTLGSLAADTGRGNMFAIIFTVFLFAQQILGNFVDELKDISELNPLNWFQLNSAILSNEVTEGVIPKILGMFVIFSILASVMFIKRDVIKEASITIPFLTRFQRRSGGNKGGKSDRDRILVRWARPLEKRFPFAADFIYSERRALLILLWVIIMFYPLQLMVYQPDNTEFIAALGVTINSFGNSGILKVFTAGHDLSGSIFLWFLMTQAVGFHWLFFTILVTRWIRKILTEDSELMTGELYGALPLKAHKVMLQRLLGAIMIMVFVVAQTVFWLLISETVIGTSYNQVWEVLTLISIIPLYTFLLTAGLSLGLLFRDGVKWARYGILFLLVWWIGGILLDIPTGIYGLYDPVLLIQEASFAAVNYGVVILFVLASIFTAAVFYLAPRFDWLRITTKAPSEFDKKNNLPVS